jgi:hypothetical protein
MEEKRNAHIGSVLRLKGTGYVEDLLVDGSIISRVDFKENQDGRLYPGIIWLRKGTNDEHFWTHCASEHTIECGIFRY